MRQVPPRRPRFLAREEFADTGASTPSFDLDTFRADQDLAFDQGQRDLVGALPGLYEGFDVDTERNDWQR